MPIESWLRSLAQPDITAIDADMDALSPGSYPLLNDAEVGNQIERLSGYLGARHQQVRRLVIAYSLYIRQVDSILQEGTRSFCAGKCPRQPAGCCTREHFTILNFTNLMAARNSPAALHMAHMIGLLQQVESRHGQGHGRELQKGGCTMLATDGCTLRLFKSPRCAHFLCADLERDMLARTGKSAAPLINALQRAESRTISSPADFVSEDVLDEGTLLYAHLRPQA